VKKARPEVEALGARLLLTGLPNLVGDTLYLDGGYKPSGRILTILTETANGNFTAFFRNSEGTGYVAGSIRYFLLIG
jgi:hypothetical protein